VLGLAVSAGCSTDDTGEDTASSSETDTGSSETDGATDGETETETGETEVDLFACGLALSCEQVIVHLDPEPRSAAECIATMMASQTPGAGSILETTGPDLFETESLSIVRGDGTVVRQTRHRECSGCDESMLAWELAAPEICRVRIDVERYQGCLMDTYDCLVSYALLECEPLEAASCEGVLADVEGEAPAPVACGDATCPFGTVCVQEPAACECNPDTGENEYVGVEPTCQNAPDACGWPEAWDAACLGALCESGGTEFDGLDGPQLSCGEAPGDCFGAC